MRKIDGWLRWVGVALAAHMSGCAENGTDGERGAATDNTATGGAPGGTAAEPDDGAPGAAAGADATEGADTVEPDVTEPETGDTGAEPEANSASGGSRGDNAGAEPDMGVAGEQGRGGSEAVDAGQDAPGGASAAQDSGMPPLDPNRYQACSGAPAPSITLTTVLDGLSSPMYAATPAGDANTMYVAQRAGQLLRVDLNTPDDRTTLLDLNANTSTECGFLSFALHPNFDGQAESRVYVSYNPICGTLQGGMGQSLVAEYEIDGDSATQVRELINIDQPQGNHNGGHVAFGPDGYLYFGLGDGGGANDQHGQNGNGQDPNTPLGALLRIDIDDPDTPVAGNLTSDDVGGGSVDGRILHWGLRNPWRYSWDRETGDLFIGDVGQNTWEEVDAVPGDSSPQNFGWAEREGLEACPGCSATLYDGTTATDPIATHARGSGGSVTGGFVYRGSQNPGLFGRYIYADYTQGSMLVVTYDGDGGGCDAEQLDVTIPGGNIGEGIVSLAEDANGELYVIHINNGAIYHIEED